MELWTHPNGCGRSSIMLFRIVKMLISAPAPINTSPVGCLFFLNTQMWESKGRPEHGKVKANVYRTELEAEGRTLEQLFFDTTEIPKE